MKRTKRILALLLLLSTLALVACDDPYDRIQGEPGEDGTNEVKEETEGEH